MILKKFDGKNLVYADIYKVTKCGDYYIASNIGVLNDDIVELQEENVLLLRVNSDENDIIQSFLKVNKIINKFICCTGEKLYTYPFGFNRNYIDINTIRPYKNKNKKLTMIN